MTPAEWAAVHRQAEYETDVAYAAGYRDGLRDASLAMSRELAAAVAPAPESARHIVQRLVALMNRAVAA